MSAAIALSHIPLKRALVNDDEPIAFARPQDQYRAHRREIDQAMQRVLNGSSYILGEEVRLFERDFAHYIGTDHAIGVANGTDAVHLALRALGIGVGDEVITPAHTAVATIAAIAMSGAAPRYADVEPGRLTLDPSAVEAAITPRTKAILVVHLYGHPADLGGLLEVAERHDLPLIEDCAQAHGALWQGRRVGSIGVIGCFSCYPTKNLGAIGDAGVITTNDRALAEQMRMLRQYGWRDRQYSEIAGFNSRLDELQAAVLRVKLRHLDAGNAERRAIARRYDAALADLPMIRPTVAHDCAPVFHLYVVRARRRDALKAWLARHGVIAGIHYPVPAHRHPGYADPCVLPVTESAADQVLSLPIYPELRDDQVARVIDAVRGYHRVEAAD